MPTRTNFLSSFLHSIIAYCFNNFLPMRISIRISYLPNLLRYHFRSMQMKNYHAMERWDVSSLKFQHWPLVSNKTKWDFTEFITETFLIVAEQKLFVLCTTIFLSVVHIVCNSEIPNIKRYYPSLITFHTLSLFIHKT